MVVRGGASAKWVGGQNEKFGTYGYNFRYLWHKKCRIFFSMPKPGALPLKLQENKVFCLILMSLWFIGNAAKMSLQYRMTDVGSGGAGDGGATQPIPRMGGVKEFWQSVHVLRYGPEIIDGAPKRLRWGTFEKEVNQILQLMTTGAATKSFSQQSRWIAYHTNKWFKQGALVLP